MKKSLLRALITAALFLSACASWVYETYPLNFKIQNDSRAIFEANYWPAYIVEFKINVDNEELEFCQAAEYLRWDAIGCAKKRTTNAAIHFSWIIRDITNNSIVMQGRDWKEDSCSAIGHRVAIACTVQTFDVKEGHRYEISVFDIVMPESGGRLEPIIDVRASAGNVWQH